MQGLLLALAVAALSVEILPRGCRSRTSLKTLLPDEKA